MSNIGKSGSTGPAGSTGGTPSIKPDGITERGTHGIEKISDIEKFKDALQKEHRKEEEARKQEEGGGSYLSERAKEQVSQKEKTTQRESQEVPQGKKEEDQRAKESDTRGKEHLAQEAEKKSIEEGKTGRLEGKQEERKGSEGENRVRSAAVQVVQDGRDKSKGQLQQGDMKISKEGKLSPQQGLQGDLKSKISDKSGKVPQVPEKKEERAKIQGQGEGIQNKSKIKIEEPRDAKHLKSKEEADTEFKGKDREGSVFSMPVQEQQAKTVGPLGQTVSVGPTQNIKAQEMADLATSMLSKLLVSSESTAGAKEVRMSFGDTGPNANPNLKNVDVVVKRDGQSLTVEFKFDKLRPENMDATRNYISQNEAVLNANLKEKLPELKDIRIDIPKSGSDSQKDQPQGQSRGKREQESSDEENAEES